MLRFRFVQVVTVLALVVISAAIVPGSSDPRYSSIIDENTTRSAAALNKVIARDIVKQYASLALSATAIAAGMEHTCALTAVGGVKCWGHNHYGQLGDGTTTRHLTPVDVSGLAGGVAAITSSGLHTCALTSTGGVKCWGLSGLSWSLTPVDVPGLMNGIVAIAAGGSWDSHTCALTNAGGVKCWGRNGSGQLGDGTTTARSTPVDVTGLTGGVIAIAAGEEYTCALTIAGGVKCWGDNDSGQLGNGTTTDSLAPVDVSGLTSGVIAIAAGGSPFFERHTCALTSAGGVKCWGSNLYGQLGSDTQDTNHLTPVDVSGLSSGAIAIAVGEHFTCAVTSAGGAKCWGNNKFGQVGDGTTANRPTPVDVSGLSSGVAAIDTGLEHTCALTSTGGVKCWGNNDFGQLGDGASGLSPTPTNVLGLTNQGAAIAAGSFHTCALTSAGGVKCWGDNFFGQLGDGTTTDRRLTPVNVSGLSSGVMTIAAGHGHTCALTSAGGVKCWGWNGSGQLGDGTRTAHRTPVDVSGLTSGVIAIATGWNHTCALTSTGGVKCWGDNYSGQLGDGTNTDRLTPVDVSGLTSGVTAITAGNRHTCAVTSAGSVKCWGDNHSGQLGDGTKTDRLTPVDVSGLNSVVTAITAGSIHTCTLTNVGGVKCWGNIFPVPSNLTPFDVPGLTSGVAAITSGFYHACAVTTGGSLKCWSDNYYGQLGDGTTTDRQTPVDVSGLSNGVTAIAAGWQHTCAVTTAGGVMCWGSNLYGQLGNGIAAYRTTPVNVVGLEGGTGYLISGQVRDANSDPIFGVFVTVDSGATAITNASGYYTITSVIAGTYTLTPAKSGYAFSPCSRTVSVPPNATGWDFTATPIDLSVDSVLPVQVLEGQNLVRDKATAIKAVIHKTGCGLVNNVSVRVNNGSVILDRFYVAEAGNSNATSRSLIFNDVFYPLNFNSSEETKVVYFFSPDLAPTGNSYVVTATVDPAGQIVEADENKNSLPSQPLQVRDKVWGDVNHPNLDLVYYRADWDSSYSEFTDFARHSDVFIKGIFPVAEGRYGSVALPNVNYSSAIWRFTVSPDNRLDEYELQRWLAWMRIMIGLAHPADDRYIAVVPRGWFAQTTSTSRLQNSVGVTLPDVPGLSLAEAWTMAKPNGISTTGHEIGHTYGLPRGCREEYDNCSVDVGGVGNYAAPGVFVSQRIPIDLPVDRGIFCVMGTANTNVIPKPLDEWEFWIDAEDYTALLTPTVNANRVSVLGATPKAILASGVITDNGAVSLSNWYVLNDAQLNMLSRGPYSFEYQDANDNILQEISFDMAFNVAGTTVSQSPFVFTIPYISGTAKIVIKNNGAPLAEKVVSPNAPVVSVISPNGGDRVARQTTIQWSGSDADGNAPSYTILFSADDGSTWEPITGDLTSTSYIWNTSNLPPGTKYRVKVIATDGINTGEDTSNSSFAVHGSVYLPLIRRSQ
jgi:alpha-tubulin suppressor-like RCC1 family protein